jgi:hypothetical protein
VFPFVGAEVGGFLDEARSVGIEPLLELAGAISSGIEGEVRLHPAGGIDLATRKILQRGCSEVVEREKLAEGGPVKDSEINRNAETQRPQRKARRLIPFHSSIRGFREI